MRRSPIGNATATTGRSELHPSATDWPNHRLDAILNASVTHASDSDPHEGAADTIRIACGIIAAACGLLLGWGATGLFVLPPLQSVPQNVGLLLTLTAGIATWLRWPRARLWLVGSGIYWAVYPLFWLLAKPAIRDVFEDWFTPAAPWSVYLLTAAILLLLAVASPRRGSRTGESPTQDPSELTPR